MMPMFLRFMLPLAALCLGSAVCAEAPVVAADIPPIQSIVSSVMEGVGTPDLLIGGGGSAHDAALRPSEARALQSADLVVWVGPALNPGLGRAIAALAPDATVLTLTELPGTELLPTRLSPLFAAAAAEHHHADEDEAGRHVDGEPDASDRSRDTDLHADARSLDPHVWLNPDNAAVWADAIASALAAGDPEHADRYAANAEAFRARLDSLDAQVEAMVAPVRGRPFVVFHDAFQYFEHRFGLPAIGAIALSDASAPGPARIAGIRAEVVRLSVVCAFSEPQFNPGLIRTVFEGVPVKTGELDPEGLHLKPGPDQYPSLILGIAQTVAACLS
jgi:zinc transport system substrate-binding protein